MPPLRSGVPLPAEKVALVDMLRVLLKSCAARNKVAPRLIADGDDLERLAVEAQPDVPAMRGWRFDLFGGYQISDNVGVSFNLLNATDELYYDALYRSATPFSYVAPGRSFKVTLDVEF